MIIVFLVLLSMVCGLWDPYEVLGLKRSATVQDIRKAYKQQAKEW